MKLYMLIPALCLALAACSEKSEPAAKKPVETVKTTSEAKAESTPTPAPASGAAVKIDPEKTGTISGTVTFDGDPPRVKYIRMGADPKCAAMHADKVASDELVVAEGSKAVKWAFVYVKSGAPEGSYPVPTEPVVLDQKGCMYEPHVFGVMAGQPILIRNSDDLLHNIHALPNVNPEFNFGQSQKGMTETKKFSQKEVMVKIKCDIHPWMGAWAGVMNHPFFAVTDAAGKFEIKGVPAGKVTLEIRQEKCAPVTVDVTVEAGKTATADAALKLQ